MDMRDQAVSDYLTFIKDPESLRDDDVINELQAQLDETDDVLETLILRSRIDQLQNVSEDTFLGPFIDNARSYAEEYNITASGFEAMGVDRKVLKQAGLITASYVTITDVTSALISSGLSEFTQPQVIKLTGAAPGTVRKALAHMVSTGQLIKTDEANPEHSGRGSKARLYRIADDELIDNEFVTLLEEEEDDLSGDVISTAGTNL